MLGNFEGKVAIIIMACAPQRPLRPQRGMTSPMKSLAVPLEVRRLLGPRLLESVYEQCLALEFSQIGISFKAQKSMPLGYKDVELDCDFIIADSPISAVCVQSQIGIHLRAISV